jgi:hypothetical protein
VAAAFGAADVTIEITFRERPTGKRYALYRIAGNLVWHGMPLRTAERALRDGHVPAGKFKGALAVAIA